MVSKIITIDGSREEGGGQIVRIALALSTLTGKPFKISNIRKNRSSPGLKAQHLHAVKALKELCNAEARGDNIGSTSLEYFPKSLDFHNLNIDIGTAGSITLFLQAVLPVMLFSDKNSIIKVRGGTDTKHSMPVDYFLHVFLPHLRRYAEIEPELKKRGYYPEGGGELILHVKPRISIKGFKDFSGFARYLRESTKSFSLKIQGKLVLIKGVSHASKSVMSASVAERQANSAKFHLSKLSVPVKIDIQYYDSVSTGSGITLWAVFSKGEEIEFDNPVILGADSLGEKGKRSETVGQEAAESLIREIESGFPADRHLADQLLIFMALTGGAINASEITGHAKANLYVIKKFLDVKLKIGKNKIEL